MNTLEYAINMEKDGEKYYREQAEINENNSLKVVCNLLADEEKKHAQILENIKNNSEYKIVESDFISIIKNVFADVKDIKVSGKQHQQLNFYRIASDMEKESIDLYKEFQSKATTDEERDVFELLVIQERQHLEVLEEIDRLLTNAEEWIESPEFGRRREEY